MAEEKTNAQATRGGGNRLEKKLSLAKLPYSRVVFGRTADANRIYNITNQLDRAVSICRNRMISNPNFSPDEVVPILTDLKETVDKLEEITIKLSSFANLKYRPSNREMAEKFKEELGLEDRVEKTKK
jgi:hypothetical protein